MNEYKYEDCKTCKGGDYPNGCYVKTCHHMFDGVVWHDKRIDQFVFLKEYKQYERVVNVCDNCPDKLYDIVDGEIPCHESCPFKYIAEHWIQIRDAHFID